MSILPELLLASGRPPTAHPDTTRHVKKSIVCAAIVSLKVFITFAPFGEAIHGERNTLQKKMVDSYERLSGNKYLINQGSIGIPGRWDGSGEKEV